MLNKRTVKAVKEEVKRFLEKLNKFEEDMEDSPDWKKYETPPWPSTSAAGLKRASLDLTKSLADMRRVRKWNEKKQRWE